MKVDAPPINGNARQKLAWLLGIVLSVLVVLALGSSAMLLQHDSTLAVHESRLTGVEHTLSRIEAKVDRLLERKP